MRKFSRPKSHTMTIHVIGSNGPEIDTVFYWRLLLHHVKHLQDLKIVFVGPEMETNCEKIECCNDCKVKRRQFNVQNVKNLYADFAAGQLFTEPDYVIGFNLGIYALSPKDTWAPSVKVLAKLKCPFILTSYAVWESILDKEKIGSILGKKIEFFWNGENPFSGLKPNRNFIDDDFFYENAYLTIYEKLS